MSGYQDLASIRGGSAAKAGYSSVVAEPYDGGALGSVSSAGAISSGLSRSSRLRIPFISAAYEKDPYWWLPCRMNRSTKAYRFTLLFLSVIVVFAGYFAFDLPSITADKLKPKLGIDNEQFGVLFSVYSMPNAVLPMLSGALFAKLGKWKGVTVIASVIAFGVFIVYLGVLSSSYPVMMLGRVLYGLGGESVFVGVDVLVTKWFAGAEIGLAYGLIQAAGQAGSFSSFYLAPPLDAALGGITYVYFASLIVSLSALACLGVARAIEKTGVGKLGAGKGTTLRVTSDGVHIEKAKAAEEGRAHTQAEMLAAALVEGTYDSKTNAVAKKFTRDRDAGDVAGTAGSGAHKDKGASKAHNESAPLLASDSDAIATGTEAVAAREDDGDDEQEDPEVAEAMARLNPCPGVPFFDKVWRLLGLGHLRRLPIDFWLVLGGIACYSSAFYTFLAFGNDWLQEEYNMDATQSGQLVGIVSIFSCFVSPAVGLLMDTRGGQREAAFAAMLGSVFSFALMGFSDAPVAFPIVCAAICYSICPASLYPILTEVVPDESFTAVYSITNSAINVILSIAYYLAGAISNAKTDPAAVGATRHSGMPGSEGNSGLDAPNGHWDPVTDGDETEGKADYSKVFVMFCIITGVGTIVTGWLLRLKILQKNGGAYTQL